MKSTMTPRNILTLWQHPLLLLLLLIFAAHHVSGAKRPNIIFIVADDAGYADFESIDPSMNTTNITALKEDGVFLNQSYVLSMCAPSRGAWMTGRYPHTFGLQDNAVNSNMINWINENFTFLPRELQRLDYTTHMLGKWHLGFCHPGLTPLGRGFDTFYGFWLGSHDSYYSHTKLDGTVYDWWDNDQPDFAARGIYQTELLNTRALKIINDYDGAKPFFMYLSYGAPHGPFEVPDYYMDTYCDHITNMSRRIHCGMTAVVDIGVGAIVSALKEKGLYEQSVIVFLSDNGGPIKGGSVNYPLRAGKKNLYEGGIRSYTIVRGPGFKHSNITWSGLVHAVDWFPTFVSIAGGRPLDYTHGHSMYEAIKEDKESPREDFIIVSDFPKFNHTMLRWRQWKLFTAVPGLSPQSRWIPGFSSGWYPPYQLLESGTPWEDFKKRYKPDQYLLYNIDQDPEERNDVYNDLKDELFVQTMKEKIHQYLGTPGIWNGTYPLQPFPSHIPTTKDNHRDGVLATCWCHPKGLPDCRKHVTTTPRGTTTDRDTSGGVGIGGDSVVGVVMMIVMLSVVMDVGFCDLAILHP